MGVGMPGRSSVARASAFYFLGPPLGQGAALLFVPASLLLPKNDGYTGAYFLIALPVQMAALLAATWLLIGKIDRVSALLKGAMVLGVFALIMGKAA